ncbi:MAG: hypothetical protein GF390_00030 [Candidatus Pacebacteria bacterium]|nr:hypothetical protein [Candidatus Paceibacterota bacterium]
MQNQNVDPTISNPDFNQQQVSEPLAQQIPPKQNKFFIPLLSTIIFVLTISTLFFAYHYFEPSLIKTTDSETETTIIPTNTPNTPVNITTDQVAANPQGHDMSNTLTAAGLFLPLPDTWKPYFTTPDQNTTIYLASTESQFNQYKQCGETHNCTDYLKLKVSGNMAVWNNKTLEEFMSQVIPEVDLNALNKTSVDGNEAWSGYTDSQQLVHQTVIKKVDENGTFIKVISAEASANNKSMLNQYVLTTKQMGLAQLSSKKASEMTSKSAYKITLISPLVTEHFGLLNTVIGNFLNTSGTNANFTYILLTEGTAGYPKNNYLNQSYNLLTDNTNLSPGSYGSEQVQIQVDKLPDNMASYFTDPKYCEQNNDCQQRTNFCTIGAFNKYHVFSTPWGCGPPDLEGFGNHELVAQQNNCSEVEIGYDSVSCVNNTCQFINPQPVCK